jgi:hypothetical protein
MQPTEFRMFAPARYAGTKTLEALLHRGLKEFPGIDRTRRLQSVSGASAAGII